MDILVSVVNQKLRVTTNLKTLVDGTQEFIRFVFNLPSEWDNLLVFAQFMQDGVAYNQYLDEDNGAYLPSEIGVGTCTLMLFGSDEDVIATTNYLTLKIEPNILVSDAQSTNISQSLYTQLVTRVNNLITWNEQNAAELVAVDRELQRQINTKADQSSLNDTNDDVSALQTALALKASQTQVDRIAQQLDALENSDVIANAITDAVAAEMQELIDSGAMASISIGDGTLSRSKVDSTFEATLDLADSAMQPSMYDPQGRRVDIFAYAQAKADTVQADVDAIKTEIHNAYVVSETLTYTNLHDSLQGILMLARNYTQAALADYNAFSISIVSELPVVGENRTFYLVPNSSGGYDKYWWITDSNNNSAWDVFGSATTEIVSTLPTVGDEDTDYILASNGTYLYYKYINGLWEMVGGAIAQVLSSLPSTGNEYTDYYVLNASGIYQHYRYINGAFKQIGMEAYTKSEIDIMLTSLEGDMETLEAQMTALGNLVSDINATTGGIVVSFKDGSTKTVQTSDNTVKVEDVNATETGIEIVYTDGDTKDIAISGGGSGQTGGSASITRITDSSIQCVHGSSCNISYSFSALDSSGDMVGSGVATWYIGGVRRATSTALQGTNIFDIGEYLSVGANNIKLSISVDTGGETNTVVTKTWSVNAVNLYLTWNYDDTTINMSDTFTLRWTPYGDLSKTTHIIIDGDTQNEVTSVTTRSGVQQYVTLDRLSHGSHTVEMYLTATINGTSVTSESVYHEMIFVTSGTSTPIIACSIEDYSTVVQYNSLQIPIVVYDPSSQTADVTLAVDGTTVATWENVDRTLHYWTYTPDTSGSKVLTITCGSVTKTIHVTVTALNIDNEEISGYSFRLKASDLAGNAALQAWSSNNIDATFSNNFDWNNGGIKTEIDESGNTRQYIRVKAGTTMTINHKLFGDDPLVNGKTFKIIFKVENCRNYDAQIAHCYADNIGLRMYAHETEVCSTGTSVSVPYGEDEYIELEFDVYPAPRAEGDGNYRYLMAWVDGVITTARVYGQSDNFTQSNANQENIVIGSTDCDVLVYMVKAYPNALTRDNHIENFIADAPNAQEMVKRFNRNDILDQAGEIDYEKLAVQNPDCRVWLYNIPRLTQGKKDYVDNCQFQQIWRNGDQYYQLTGVGRMSVQGTSSVDYLNGAANTDINFANGTLVDGNGNDLLDDSLTIKGFKINDDSEPITYSNTKVNFASCEQVNNMCNAEWYQTYQPYPSLTARDCMEFAMGVQFINDQSGALWDDNKYHMYSIANMGNSKKNVHVFHDTSNENECCIEVNNNLNAQCRMISDDLTDEDWSGDYYFGMRYPDTKNPSSAIKNGWQRFLTWMATNNPNAATGDALASPVTFGNYTFRGHSREGTQVLKDTIVTQYAGTYTHDTFNYRMAKMLSECEDYMVMDSVVYHFCYIERHTMVDNVAKNTFWSSSDLVHWDLSKAYDMDTSDGNNNEGQMVFDYGNEATDTIGTKTVFNAADSVWFVFVSNLYEACQTMFINRESAGAWDKTAYHNFFLSQQQKVPERVWVQCYWYDYLRTYEQGINADWMSFLDGGQKTHQRWHYETFEEAYDASKYRGTACTSQNVTIRGYTPTTWTGVEPNSAISIKMYNKCYIVIRIDQIYKSVKAERGVTYTIDFSDVGTLNDTVINLYTAQMIQEIGDISPLYPGFCSFANAKRLRSLQVGNNTVGYSNTNLESLDFGNNTMLEYLYVQNLPNANTTLDLTNCPSLLYLDATGSSFTGYDFAVGGLLTTAYIESPTSLSLRDLYYLTDANFHVTSYNSLTTLRIENCDNIDSLAIVNAATNLSRLRLLGIEWTLSDTTLLNNLLTLLGIDANGYNTAISVLTGSAYVSGAIRNQELLNYANAWDNLTVTYNPNNLVTQYLVTYYNDDETTILFTTYVDRGAYPPDPYAEGWIEIPTHESDAQYVYTFDDWDGIDEAVLASTSIVATYTKTVRQYTVTWYSRAGLPLETQTASYGACVTYSGDIPTRTDEESSYIYNVFMQWDKSTGFITGDTDVYAVWDRKERPVSGRDVSTMSPAEIYGVCQSGLASTYFADKDYFDFTMGSDFTFSNVNETTIATERYFDGTQYLDTEIALFDEDSPSFTLAIDFEFLSTNETGASLVACFDETGNEGFRLRYSSNPNIQWGDKSTDVGYQDQRGICVLRHIQGSSHLFVYSLGQASTIYSGTQNVVELVRTRDTSTDLTLCLGAVGFSDGGHDYHAKGWVHWCKIWYDDLGASVAAKLASFPHETQRMEFAGADRYRLAGQTSTRANSSWIANNPLALLKRMNASNTNAGGWDGSEMRTFLNSIIWDAFPYWLQAIIKTVKINASAGSQSTEIITSEDNVYLPANRELGGWTSSPYADEGSAISFFTNNASRVKIPGFIIPEDASFYSVNSDPTALSGYNVKEGDIWIHTGNDSIGYIYVSAATKAKHTRMGFKSISDSTTLAASNGGCWIRANAWWERSPNASNSTNFVYVNSNGNPNSGNFASGANGVVLCFAI